MICHQNEKLSLHTRAFSSIVDELNDIVITVGHEFPWLIIFRYTQNPCLVLAVYKNNQRNLINRQKHNVILPTFNKKCSVSRCMCGLVFRYCCVAMVWEMLYIKCSHIFTQQTTICMFTCKTECRVANTPIDGNQQIARKLDNIPVHLGMFSSPQ